MLCDCDSEVTISSRFTFRPVLNTFYLVGNNITLANIILLTIITCVTLIDPIINMVIPIKHMVKNIIGGNTNYQFNMYTTYTLHARQMYSLCMAFTLLSSTSLVSITMVVTLCSHTILQKSSTVLLTGPCVAM